MVDWFKDLWGSMLHSMSTFNFIDAVDILCVAVILYFIYKFISQRRAGKLALGLVFLVLLFIISNLLDMKTIGFVLQNVFQVGILALLVVFQPELRAALEKMGGGSIKGIIGISEHKKDGDVSLMIENVACALQDLSDSKTGALVVFERSTKLGDLVLTGTMIDSFPATYLVKNIFYNKAPLHDGALIVRDARLYSAGCLLPLSQNPDIIKDLGTRHRAAIGMSENSDAVVAVVSEETGKISVAFEGKLTSGYNKESLVNTLSKYLLPQTQRQKKKILSKSDKKTEAENE